MDNTSIIEVLSPELEQSYNIKHLTGDRTNFTDLPENIKFRDIESIAVIEPQRKNSNRKVYSEIPLPILEFNLPSCQSLFRKKLDIVEIDPGNFEFSFENIPRNLTNNYTSSNNFSKLTIEEYFPPNNVIYDRLSTVNSSQKLHCATKNLHNITNRQDSPDSFNNNHSSVKPSKSPAVPNNFSSGVLYPDICCAPVNSISGGNCNHSDNNYANFCSDTIENLSANNTFFPLITETTISNINCQKLDSSKVTCVPDKGKIEILDSTITNFKTICDKSEETEIQTVLNGVNFQTVTNIKEDKSHSDFNYSDVTSSSYNTLETADNFSESDKTISKIFVDKGVNTDLENKVDHKNFNFVNFPENHIILQSTSKTKSNSDALNKEHIKNTIDILKTPGGNVKDSPKSTEVGVQTISKSEYKYFPVYNRSQVKVRNDFLSVNNNHSPSEFSVLDNKQHNPSLVDNLNKSDNASVTTILKSLGDNNFELISSVSKVNNSEKEFEIKTPISVLVATPLSNSGFNCGNAYPSSCFPNPYITSPNFSNLPQPLCLTNFQSPPYDLNLDSMYNPPQSQQNQQNPPGRTAIPITASTVSSSLSPNKWVPREALNLNEFDASFLPKWVTLRDSNQPPIAVQPCRISNANSFSGHSGMNIGEEAPIVTINPPISTSDLYSSPHYHQCIMPIPGSQLDYYKIPNYWYMAQPQTSGVGYCGESNFF